MARSTFPLIVALFASACAESARDARLALNAPWTDSVRLQETDSAFLASPSGLVVSADGRIFVSDIAAGQVLAFDDAGSFVGRYGRRGRGPGELLGPSVLEIRGGDELLVLDNPTARVSMSKRDTRAVGLSSTKSSSPPRISSTDGPSSSPGPRPRRP